MMEAKPIPEVVEWDGDKFVGVPAPPQEGVTVVSGYGGAMLAASDLLAEAERQVEWLHHLRAEAAGKLRGSLITGIDQSIKYLNAAIAKARGEAA